MEIELSVIVTAYNVEKYIEDCVKSLINQTYRNMEIIIIDDGSSDNTPHICDEIKKNNNNIKVIHKKNEGVIKARFDGAKNACGKYVTFVDGDDWIDINAYKELMEYNKIECLWKLMREERLPNGFFQ